MINKTLTEETFSKIGNGAIRLIAILRKVNHLSFVGVQEGFRNRRARERVSLHQDGALCLSQLLNNRLCAPPARGEKD